MSVKHHMRKTLIIYMNLQSCLEKTHTKKPHARLNNMTQSPTRRWILSVVLLFWGCQKCKKRSKNLRKTNSLNNSSTTFKHNFVFFNLSPPACSEEKFPHRQSDLLPLRQKKQFAKGFISNVAELKSRNPSGKKKRCILCDGDTSALLLYATGKLVFKQFQHS